MCSLQEHSARSAREHEAQAQEPIYTALAKERGVEWVDLPPAEEYEEIRAGDNKVIRVEVTTRMAQFQDALGDYYDAGMIGTAPRLEDFPPNG